MSEQMIIEQCSPTLAGLKTGNLFPCEYSTKQALFDDIRKFNKALCYKGIRMIPVRTKENHALIYLYRPSKLQDDLKDKLASQMLLNLGYSKSSAEKCVAELTQRLNEEESFPHEIGLFLGYPPEDVKGFIDNKAEKSKCVGCWKVYGDKTYAEKCFLSYKKCTRIYKEQFFKGKSIERLTVAV